jgi:acyl carrier protein
MDNNQIEADIIHFLEANILHENIKIPANKLLRELGIDSFSIVEIILFIERKYGSVIPDNQLLPENFKTVQAIAKLVSTTGFLVHGNKK